MNLVDKRPQGFGKTTEAIERAIERAKQGEQTIYVVDSYAKAEEFAGMIKDVDCMVFYGKPQPLPDQPEPTEFDDEGNELIERMCKRLPQNNRKPRLFEKLIPRFLCKTCKDRSCQYLIQCEQSKDDSIIFCVKENLGPVLKLVKNATVVLDDVSPVSILWQRVEVTEKQIEATLKLAEKKGQHRLRKAVAAYQAGDYEKALQIAGTKSYLQDLIAAEQELLRKRTDFEKEIEDKEFELRQEKDEHMEELNDMERGRIEAESEKELRDFYILRDERELGIMQLEDKIKDLKQTGNYNLIYALYDAAKAVDYEFSDAIEWKNDTIKKAKDVELIKASINSLELDLFAELGNYQDVEAEAPHNDNIRVVQITDSKFSMTSQKWRPDRYFIEPCRIVNQIADFCKPLGMKIRAIAPRATIRKNSSDPIVSSLESNQCVDFDYHYSPRTSGSNTYIYYNVHTALGILYKPLLSYNRAPYKRYFEKLQGLDPSKSYDDIAREMAEEEQLLYQRDLAERLRLSTSTDRKLVIIFGDIDISDWPFQVVKTKLENAEKVLRDQVAWASENKLKARVLSALKKAVRTGKPELKPLVDAFTNGYGYFGADFYREKFKGVAVRVNIVVDRIKGYLYLNLNSKDPEIFFEHDHDVTAPGGWVVTSDPKPPPGQEKLTGV